MMSVSVPLSGESLASTEFITAASAGIVIIMGASAPVWGLP
jgi:hypothetical protein